MEGDDSIHLVETQWHYKTLTKFGYVPDTKEDVGYVRAYDYHHPVTGSRITVNTGVNADYWNDRDNGAHGYWGTLEAHLEKITSN